jgi:hypothetical protein
MSWLFSQALVEAYSADTSSGGEPCAPLNVMLTPHPFWHRDKTTDISRRSPSGLTCAVLTDTHGAALLTSFQEASRARTSPPPERVSASAESVPGCGQKWRGLSVKFDPVSSSWKTHHSLFPEDLDWSSLTLPAWGMMQAGELWERTTPGLPIAENESGSGENWPTPKARDWKDTQGQAPDGTNPDGTNPDGTFRDRTDTLATRVYHGGTKTRQTWPTPLSTDATHGGPNQRDSSGRLGLTAQAIRQTWPTPTVFGNYNQKGMSPNSGDGLATAVKQSESSPKLTDHQSIPLTSPDDLSLAEAGASMSPHTDSAKSRKICSTTPNLKKAGSEKTMWPTPRAGKTSDENEESWKARNADGQVSTPPLTLAVKLWATPQARDFRSGEGHRFENPERTKNLNDQAAQTEASGQLNPDWVEWLMGWPIGWTASAPLATDKFRQWCASHGRR